MKTARIYGEPVNQFFIDIAFGDGMIFVPCQVNNLDDGTGVNGCFFRVFDADTLEQLYVTESIATGQMQSPVMYHNGYFVTAPMAVTAFTPASQQKMRIPHAAMR